jgi:hypothetical protein
MQGHYIVMKYYALILTKIILNFRKLKNRVAAQSSRDRKKARLDDLEAEVRNLREKVCAIHVYLYSFLSHTYITGTEKKCILLTLSFVIYVQLQLMFTLLLFIMNHTTCLGLVVHHQGYKLCA